MSYRFFFMGLLSFFTLTLLGQKGDEAIIEWPGGLIDCDTNQYQLVFSEEFNSGQLDTTKWYTYYPYGPNHSDDCSFCRTHGNDELQFYSEEALIFTDSTLQLTAFRKDTVWYGVRKPFHSGMVHSKLHFKYGKFEIRCKLPKGRGFWPAFWLWGGDELDVFEFCMHKPNILKSNVHMTSEEGHFMRSKSYKGNDYSKGFHTFSVEWEPLHIIWSIDGKVIRKMHCYSQGKRNLDCGDVVPAGYLKENKLIPDAYMQVIANLALSKKGAYCKRKGINKSTPFPASLEIDYIRVYQKDRMMKRMN